MKDCKNGAEYVVLSRKSKGKRGDHAFACGDHLGELIVVAMDSSHNCRVTVRYVPDPGDQPCEKGVE